ncbi:hypothetical protein BH11PSE7_BH11PSE7_01960 [soil metagenome]
MALPKSVFLMESHRAMPPHRFASETRILSGDDTQA